MKLKDETQWLWQKYNFTPRKDLGQHFLIDPRILEKILEALHLENEDEVLEIGAGTGTLTEKLAQEKVHVLAVEVDKVLCRILEDRLSGYANVRIVGQDIRRISLEDHFKGNFKVVGNLPYQIASSVLLDLAKRRDIDFLVVMVQREVAQKLLSPPGSKKRTALTVLMEHYAQVERIIDVPPHVFVPRPRVSSTLLRIRRKTSRTEEGEAISMIVRVSFSSRRRMLINAISGALGMERSLAKKRFEEAGIDEKLRAEDLAHEDFLKLARAFRDKNRASKK